MIFDNIDTTNLTTNLPLLPLPVTELLSFISNFKMPNPKSFSLDNHEPDEFKLQEIPTRFKWPKTKAWGGAESRIKGNGGPQTWIIVAINLERRENRTDPPFTKYWPSLCSFWSFHYILHPFYIYSCLRLLTNQGFQWGWVVA